MSLALVLAVGVVPISIFAAIDGDFALVTALVPIAVGILAFHLLWRIARASERTADAVEGLHEQDNR